MNLRLWPKGARVKNFFMVLTLVCSVLASQPAFAQSGSSAENFAVLQKTRAFLDGVAQADFIPPSTDPQKTFVLRQPRHVYYKARHVATTLNRLMILHGLPTPALPNLVIGSISKDDVQQLISHIAQGAESLSDYFDAPFTPPTTTSLLAEVTPTQVYQALDTLEHKLISLGALPPTPNDVFIISQHVLDSLQLIARAQEKEDTVTPSPLTKPITPKAAYTLAHELMQDLQALIKNKGSNFIAGGILVPHSPIVAAPKPEDVLDLLVNIQAEIHALRIAYKVNTSKNTSPYSGVAGKTPQDVYQLLYMAQTVLWQFN